MNKNRYIENIIIGTPLINPAEIFSKNIIDWELNEGLKTHYTNERFLPKILVELGIYPSINEIRRNRKDLMITLDKLDYIDGLKVSKKRKLYILIGE